MRDLPPANPSEWGEDWIQASHPMGEDPHAEGLVWKEGGQHWHIVEEKMLLGSSKKRLNVIFLQFPVFPSARQGA